MTLANFRMTSYLTGRCRGGLTRERGRGCGRHQAGGLADRHAQRTIRIRREPNEKKAISQKLTYQAWWSSGDCRRDLIERETGQRRMVERMSSMEESGSRARTPPSRTKLGGVVGPCVGRDVGNDVGVVVGVRLGTVVGAWAREGMCKKMRFVRVDWAPSGG